MRKNILLMALPGLALACTGDRTVAPPLDLSEVPRNTIRDFDTDGLLEVYFTTPGTERGEEVDPELDDALVALIDAATTSIDLCLYEFKRSNVITAVLAAHDRGVDIRMVGDGDEALDSGYLALEDVGIHIEMRKPRDRIMHNKFVVVDGQAVWTGSTNATETGILQNNNNAVIIESTVMAEEYTREFEQMYVHGEFGRKKDDIAEARSFSFRDQDIVFHFSPEHDPIRDLVDLVDSADHTLHFMIFSYTHPDVLAAMVAARDRGVEVVGIFDESQARGRYSVDELLALEGIPTYIDGNHNATGFAGGKLHHKALIIDAGVDSSDPVVAMGSFNWSNSATRYNDENLVELRDPALINLYAQEFCRVFDVATPHPEFASEPVEPCVRVPELFINELLPDPAGTDRGQEFVEIINVGVTAVNLDGWTLGDATHPIRHVFGATVLEPGDGLVVFDQGDHSHIPKSQVSSTGFLSLNNGGDTIILADPAGAIIDRVDYAGSISGVSWNRATDMDKTAAFTAHDRVSPTLTESSPGTRADGEDFTHVEVPDFHIVLNELMPNPTGTDTGNEYIELINLGPDPADLEGWSVYDVSGIRHEFTDTILEAGEALVLFDRGDHSEVPGAIESSTGTLSLNNTGDALTLYTNDGALHDQVDWATAREGVAWNRLVDGALGSELAYHDDVDPGGAASSPGLRADGSAW